MMTWSNEDEDRREVPRPRWFALVDRIHEALAEDGPTPSSDAIMACLFVITAALRSAPSEAIFAREAEVLKASLETLLKFAGHTRGGDSGRV